MKSFGEPRAGMIVFSLLNNASYAIYQCEAKYIYLWMALWFDRKASKEAICSELADVRNGSFEVGGSEPFCPCLSLSLSASTSFQSCLAAAKTHKLYWQKPITPHFTCCKQDEIAVAYSICVHKDISTFLFFSTSKQIDLQ